MKTCKNKAVTFSFDDGIIQDKRLIEIFDKYGLYGTFHLNYELMGTRTKFEAKDIREIYQGHEVAGHTLTHSKLTEIADDNEIIRQVEEDRQRLSELVGYEVCSFAYPGGGENGNAHIARLIREHTGIKYARVGRTNNRFSLQDDLFLFEATVDAYNEEEKLIPLAEEFLSLRPDEPCIFSIRGHAYEFDIRPGSWEIFEEFCRMIGGQPDIFYGTNKDVILSRDWK